MGKNRWFLPLTSFLGFAFLYAPILSLVIFSFNANRLVTVWSGFSTQSYVDLWNDPQLLPAALLSLQIGAVAASIALVLGCDVADLIPSPSEWGGISRSVAPVRQNVVEQVLRKAEQQRRRADG